MMWSSTLTPISSPASRNRRVISMSSLLGVGFPDGWLCSRMIARRRRQECGFEYFPWMDDTLIQEPIATSSTQQIRFFAVQVNGKEILLCFIPQKAEGVEDLLRAGKSDEWLQILMMLFLDGQRFVNRPDLFELYCFGFAGTGISPNVFSPDMFTLLYGCIQKPGTGLFTNPVQQEAFTLMFAAKNIFAFGRVLVFSKILFQPVEMDSYVGSCFPAVSKKLHGIVIKKSLGTW